MTRTLSAETSAQWLKDLSDISLVLQMVTGIQPSIPHHLWTRVWDANVRAKTVRDQLMAHVLVDAEVETRARMIDIAELMCVRWYGICAPHIHPRQRIVHNIWSLAILEQAATDARQTGVLRMWEFSDGSKLFADPNAEFVAWK